MCYVSKIWIIFPDRELIGKGAFGSVYLGRLSDGKLVAVKVCSNEAQLGADPVVIVNDVS